MNHTHHHSHGEMFPKVLIHTTEYMLITKHCGNHLRAQDRMHKDVYEIKVEKFMMVRSTFIECEMCSTLKKCGSKHILNFM